MPFCFGRSKSLERKKLRGWLDALLVSGYYRAGNSIWAYCGSTMERVDRLRRGFFSNQPPKFGSRISLTFFCLALAILVVALLAARVHSIDLSSLLLGIALTTLCVVLFFLFRFLHIAHQQHARADTALDSTEISLLESEERFRQMADNIQEIFWMIDVETRKTIYVNPAYETITGRPREVLKKDPLSHEEIIHSDDRVQVLLKLEEASRTGDLDERFRIVVPSGEARWVWVRGFPVRDAKGRIRRLVGTALDITTQKHAEDEVARNLSIAQSAWSEADAMRKATLALTQDLRMDSVLDTLLQAVAELIPYEFAQILLVESETRLFLAREAHRPPVTTQLDKYPLTFDAADFPLLQRALSNQSGTLLADTKEEAEWRTIRGSGQLRSWLCVPLVASRKSLGLLSLGHCTSDSFTHEHLRLAKSLAIPAAAAIQNARLYECAQIYGAELNRRGADVPGAPDLGQRFQDRRPS
jgi:PAS domain S-box-containing protein